MGKKKILVTDIFGTIEQNSFRNNAFNSLIDTLNDLIYEFEEYDGILLNINSPGGSAGLSCEIASLIYTIRRFKHIPIIASVTDLACSGGYLIAASCNKIIVNDMSLIGSIGVIMQIPQVKPLAEKIGIDFETIKSCEYKDVGNIFKNISEKEKTYLQNLVKNSHSNFVSLVNHYRPNVDFNNEQIHSGRVFTANEALVYNLIDEIGNSSDAYYELAKLLDCHVKDLKLCRKNKKNILSRVLHLLSNIHINVKLPNYGLK